MDPVGPFSDRPCSRANAYLATGHGLSGVTLAPVTGRRLAELILTGRRADVLRPFAIDHPSLGASAVSPGDQVDGGTRPRIRRRAT